MYVMNIILNTLGIFAIIVFGAFILVSFIDLFLSIADRKRDGIIIHSAKAEEKTFAMDYQVEDEKVFPLVEKKEEYQPVDMQKALEEQRILEARLQSNNIRPKEEIKHEEPMFSNLEKLVEEDDDDFFADDGEEELDNILSDLTKKIKDDEEKPVMVKQTSVKPAVVEPIVVEEDDEDDTLEEQPIIEVKPKTIVKEKVVYVDDDLQIKELRKLRKDLLVNKSEALQKLQIENDKDKEYAARLKELDELKEFKKKNLEEKGLSINSRLKNLSQNNAIVQENMNQRQKYKILEEEKAKLVEEKELLAKELDGIKQIPVEEIEKPYFTREHYESKLEILEKELAEVSKELRVNKREYNPIVKVKKLLAKNSEKLRKIEMSVAKQKIALYGAKSPKIIDQKKKEKLDAEVATLKELKDSVIHCETVIKKNAERFPILERTNKLLTKQTDRVKRDIENVKEAIRWYDEHEEKE